MGGFCVVNGSFMFVLRLSRLFGSAPVRFKPVQDGCRIEPLKSSSYEYIFIVFLNGINFIFSFFEIIYPGITGNIHVISLILRTLFWTTQTIFLNIAILSSKACLESLIDCVPINKKTNLARERRRSLLIAFYTLLRIGCTFIPYIYTRKFKVAMFAECFLNIILQLSQTVIELKTGFIKFEIHKYMETIKFELMDIIADIKSDKKPKPPVCDIRISICALSKAFVSTCNIVFKLNTSENLLAVTLASMITIHLVGTVSNFAAAITSTDYEHKTEQSCVELVWLILHILRVILYVEASDQIRKEVDVIRLQVGELSRLVTQVGEKILLEVDIFQVVVLINYPETTPMGFFTVSRELLGPIFSTFITYGIVMVQISSYFTY